MTSITSTSKNFNKEQTKSKWFHLRMEIKYVSTKIAAGICSKLNCLLYINDEIKISKNNKNYQEGIICLRGQSLNEEDIKLEIMKIACFVYKNNEMDSYPLDGFIYVRPIYYLTNVSYFLKNFNITSKFLNLCEKECNTSIPKHLKAYVDILSSLEEKDSNINIPKIDFDMSQWNEKMLTCSNLWKSNSEKSNKRKKSNLNTEQRIKKKRQSLEQRIAWLESQESQPFIDSEVESSNENEDETEIESVHSEENLEDHTEGSQENIDSITSFINNLKDHDENVVVQVSFPFFTIKQTYSIQTK